MPLSKINDWLDRFKRSQAIKILTTADPERLEEYGKKLLIPAFQRATSRVPAYQKILAAAGTKTGQVTDIATFKKHVPVIDKHETFARFEIEQLCVDGDLRPMKLAMSSSGFSGTFSYGINTETNQRHTAKSIDTALDITFGISRKKTFLVNCIPMGVKVNTSLQLAETSVRPDMALAIIKKFSHKFEQTLIVSDPHFLKKLVEDGSQDGLNWKKLNVSLISGEDWFSESFRSYLAHTIDLDLNNHASGRLIGATMGIAELDLNLFHESWHSIMIRRAAQDNPSLREDLFGKNTRACPILFHYYPHRIFLEALPEGTTEQELVFSMLSPHMLIPLLRYNSGDKGGIMPHKKMLQILKKHNLTHLTPELKLPFVWVSGRKDRFLEINGIPVYPEEIKQGLYEDFDVASKTTGYFRLNTNTKTLEIQLKKGVALTDELRGRFEKALLKHTLHPLPIVIYHYQDFPYAMELDYERKFHHL